MTQIRLFAIICLFFSCLPANANPGYSFSGMSPDQPSRFEQRKLYKQLLHLIKTNQRTRYLAKESQLVGYPLYPYLEYTAKSHRISRQSESSISSFIELYRNTPLANRLLQNWLKSLGNRGEWKKITANYTPHGATDVNTCHYAYALYKNDNIDEAMQLAEKLWLVKSSQPKACDPILKAWRAAKNLTRDLAWQRYSMALTANNVTLARYLIRFVDDQDKVLANNFRMAHIRPGYINRTQLFTGTDDKSRSVILHGIKRLAGRDPVKALETLNKYQISHRFPLPELKSISTYIGIRLARDPDTLHALNKMPVNLSQDQEVISARLLTALKQLSWNDVLAYIHNLESHAQLSNRWQYWKARILSGSDDIYDQQTASGIFESLADHRGFYGFMSADILDRKYNFEDESIAVSDAEILALEEMSGIQRALELFVLDEPLQARREWNFATRYFSPMQLQIAARVARKWGWHNKAISAIIEAKAWNDLDIRFPLAFHDNFIIGARKADIPVDWNIAIARQESAFMPDARSPVGARGIMQLMPATARLTARRVGMSAPSTRDLNNPTTNIQLGSAYLGQMMRKFGNNRILASAAYNAGPARVTSWLDDKLPLDVWIETIPYDETRNYVMNVLVFSAIYSRKLNRHSPLVYDHERRSFSRQQITSSGIGAPDNS